MRSTKRSPWRSITLATRRMSIRSLPMPMIMGLCPRPAPIHRRAHGADGLAQAHEDRFANHVIADVELDDLGQCRNGLRRRIIEAVAGMDFEAGRARQPGASENALPLDFCLVLVAIS